MCFASSLFPFRIPQFSPLNCDDPCSLVQLISPEFAPPQLNKPYYISYNRTIEHSKCIISNVDSIGNAAFLFTSGPHHFVTAIHCMDCIT